MAKFTLNVSCVVPMQGTLEVEADSIEDAIEKLREDAYANRWDGIAWQNSKFADDIDWGAAQEFGIEPTKLPDGTMTDYCELIE